MTVGAVHALHAVSSSVVAGGAVAAGVVAVAAVLGALVLRRRGGDEVHSVRTYERTRDTLQSIGARSVSTSVRVIGRDAPGGVDRPPPPVAGDETDPAGAAPPVRARPGPAGGRPLVLGDDDATPLSGFDTPRRRSRAMDAMNRRPRHLGAPVAAVVVVAAVLGVVVYLGDRAHHHGRGGASAVATTAPTAHRQHGSGGPSTTTSHPGHRHAKPAKGSTTTTLPLRYSPTAATATTATYVPPTSHYTLGVGATTGPCWVSVTNAGGATLVAQVLTARTSQTFAMTGSATVVIGAPSVVAVTIDGAPVVLPSGYQTPFEMTVAPAAA